MTDAFHREHLPQLTEEIDAAGVEVTEWMVAPGDPVHPGTPLVWVEMSKVGVQIPATRAGRVVEILAHRGDTVRTGDPLIVLDVTPGTVACLPPPSPPRRASLADRAWRWLLG